MVVHSFTLIENSLFYHQWLHPLVKGLGYIFLDYIQLFKFETLQCTTWKLIKILNAWYWITNHTSNEWYCKTLYIYMYYLTFMEWKSLIHQLQPLSLSGLFFSGFFFVRRCKILATFSLSDYVATEIGLRLNFPKQ